MKRYRVTFSENAASEFASSFEWGRETWGEEAALRWYINTRDSILQLLGTFPLSQPIAPDQGEFEVEVRQMIVARYRVLFAVQGKTVIVLHFRGPYAG